jgi:L-asparaginase/Glu-tRNA(Gln) amidotransferase subunit D
VIRQKSLRRFKVHKGKRSSACCVTLHLTARRYESRRRYGTSTFVYILPQNAILITRTATLRLFPGITGATVRAFLAPPIRGVVLETFGAGNAPQRADLKDALREACDRGVVIVAISQCAKGAVSSTYATGQALLQLGVVAGSDMTPEVWKFYLHQLVL